MFKIQFLPTLPSLLSERDTPLVHRDLSWLQFNERVLAEARHSSGNPLLERAKFLAISASNLDEFFMIRFPSVERTLSSHQKKETAESKSLIRRLVRIRGALLEAVAKFGSKQAEALEALSSELEGAGISIVRQARDGDPAFGIGKKIFDDEVFSRLTPPEPYVASQLHQLENLQLAAIFPSGTWLRIPRTLPQTYWFKQEDSGTIYLFFLDDLLQTHLGASLNLPGQPALVRLTRDSDIALDLDEEDTESIPDVIRGGLSRRERGKPVRLQYGGEFSDSFLTHCMAALKLNPVQLLSAAPTLCLQGLWSAVNSIPESYLRPGPFKHPPLQASIPRAVSSRESLFEKVRQQDFLLHHPYDSFEAFIAWIQNACDDPAVECIEQTVYRTDAVSPLIEAMKAAARNKKIRVLIEPRARFDELNNLRLADELRKAGVEVGFGLGKLKVHAKIALITRREGDGLKLYTHLSTGNYHAATARQYTDLAIFTSNADIGTDAKNFFDSAMSGAVPHAFKQLVSAPTRLHRRLLSLIQAETQAAEKGEKARIVAKVNALVDPTVIEALYRASRAGVKVDLIVRGACSLIPGVKGLSENIRVISIIDRFLEHSRIYYFESSKAMYLSSADWMPRNFFSRLEIAFPVLDPHLYSYLESVLIPTYLGATEKAYELTPQGTWRKRTSRASSPKVRPQFVFEKLAQEAYKGTPLE